MKERKLICFDLDGVLANTEPLHHRAKERLVGILGYREPICYADFVGRPNRDFWAPILASLPTAGETEETMERRQYEVILEIAREEKLPPSNGLIDLLEALQLRRVCTAVCSSSDRHYVERMLRHLGIEQYIGFLVGGDEVARKKPAPDVYRKALDHFGMDGSEAVAIEDSAAGVSAATGAGMDCIGYANPTSGNQDLTKAAHVADCFSQIQALLLGGV